MKKVDLEATYYWARALEDLWRAQALGAPSAQIQQLEAVVRLRAPIWAGGMIVSRRETGRLNEFDKDEWRDVAKALRPEWTEAEFEAAWAGYEAEKARRAAN